MEEKATITSNYQQGLTVLERCCVKKELIIIGAGGYAKSVLDSFDRQQYDLKGFLDERPDKEEHFGYPVLTHSLDDIPHPENFSFFIAIGSDPKRKIWFDKLSELGADFASVWDPSAIVSPLAKVGKGCFIGKMAIVNAGVEIGDNVVVNTMALVEHGSGVKSHANISTKAVLNGDVLIGEGTFVGSGSVVIGQLSVGSWSIVGAGAVVTKDVESGVTVAGVPARVVRREARFW